MDKIVWQLGADSSQVRSEMDKAVANANRGTAGISTGFGTASRSHERFLESNNRVTNQVAAFTRSLLSARSATDVLASGLDRLENSTNLSLAAGISLAAGAVIVSKIGEIRKEYQALAEDLKKVHEAASKTGDFKTMSKLEEEITKADNALKKLQERIDTRSGGGFWSGLMQRMKDTVMFGNAAAGAAGSKSDRSAADVSYADQDKLMADVIQKRRQQTGLKESELAGVPDHAIKAAQVLIAANEKVIRSLDEMAQVARETSVALQEILKVRNDKAMERSGVSLSEAANLPDVVDNSVSYERWKASQDAKRAIGLKGQGEAARLNMQPDAAHNLFNQSGEAAEGITGLKPSERMAVDFKGALAVSEDYLRQLAESKAVLVNK